MAGHEGNANLGYRARQQFGAIEMRWQVHPHEHAAARLSPAHASRHMTLQRGEQRIAAAFIERADGFEPRREAIRNHVVQHHLV